MGNVPKPSGIVIVEDPIVVSVRRMVDVTAVMAGILLYVVVMVFGGVFFGMVGILIVEVLVLHGDFSAILLEI